MQDRIADAFISPLYLVTIGMMSAEEAAAAERVATGGKGTGPKVPEARAPQDEVTGADVSTS